MSFLQNAIQKSPVDNASPNSGLREKQVDAETRKTAQDFEALLVTFLLKTMRKSIPESSLFGSNFAGDMYKGLFDEKLAETISRKGGIGLADTIIDGMRDKNPATESEESEALSSELKNNYGDLLNEMALQNKLFSVKAQEKP